MSFFDFLANVLVSIEMLIISVMGVTNISRQNFSTFVGMGSRSHDFDDELKISILLSSVARSREFILELISGFCTDGILCTLSGNLELIIAILSTKCLEKCIVLMCLERASIHSRIHSTTFSCTATHHSVIMC